MTNITNNPRKSPTIALIIAWAVVSLPAAWGVARTIRTSLTLFEHSSPAAPATQPASSQPANY